ncbi:MAG: thymidine kinase [Gammaproteobacteria bacterium]|nr:thymidine kinase [Gammaproteobacteria bacterium]
MSKLFFRYGAMNSGKSTAMLQVAHNYEERDQSVVLVKSSVDTKGDDQIVSRLGVTRRADLLLSPGQDLRGALKALSTQRSDLSDGVACVLIDEAQFLTPEQVDQALAIAVLDEIPVVAFGIRTDFRTKAFPGSQRLMEVAHSLQEMKTICRCGNKAVFNARLGEHGIIREGEQVMIDGEAARYEALCARCYLEADGA